MAARSIAALAVVALAAVTFGGPPAGASREPTAAGESSVHRAAASTPRLRLAPTVVARGGTITFTGYGFRPRARVELLVGPPRSEASPVGTARTDAHGAFRRRVRTSARARPGRYVALACQAECRIKASAAFRLRA